MTILEYVKEHITYLDGGMGTLLQKAGLKPGELPERWNLSHPEEVISVHRGYFDAGSNVVSTNTFGANIFKYDEKELEEIVAAAIKNVRLAAKESNKGQEKYVALDVGSLGKLLKPLGDLDFEDAVNAYAKTMKLGEKYGADLIFIETMNDSYDTKAALLAAKENTKLPVFVSNAYGEDGKLMTGANPEAMVAMLEGMGADAIGINCSLGPKQMKAVVEEYIRYASVPVLVKPNAGIPRSENGVTVFDVHAPEFAEDVCGFLRSGARLAGGCCGTTPEYIRALTEGSKGYSPVALTNKRRSVISSYTHAVSFGKKPILIGERINPTGKKRFKEALRNNEIDYVLSVGSEEQEKGADVLDVNVGLPEIDEVKLLTLISGELQAIIDLPLQIDTTDVRAMESALRRYNGKALINSVNGKDEVMDAIFPLAKKYGGMIVCLTLDEGGIPCTAQERLSIAKKILSKAQSYGIAKEELIFDPLAMAVSADKDAAMVTLKAVELLNEEGLLTSLGVSNVSFGLPKREIVTASFFACAMEKGLSAAIMNPNSAEMMKTYYSFCTLHGMDENCTNYIENIERFDVLTDSVKIETKGSSLPTFGELQTGIIKGMKEKAAAITEKLLEEGTDPLAIVNEQIIPALDYVGVGFEKKTMYLPQLLMSAEASQCAFEKIKAAVQKSESERSRSEKNESAKPMRFVIATVHGDIHDIGKNIVKLILENYGFEVTDLGKDVPPETVAKTVRELEAPLVGLSALMTTTVPAMEETIKLIRKEAPFAKVLVGGAVLTQEYADSIGADFYGKDAMATVRFACKERGDV